MLSTFKNVCSRLLVKLSLPKKNLNLTDYWCNRARRFGKRSVLNMAHGEEEFEIVTAYQKQLLFPLLKSQLTGYENQLLDFGCGPGRFSSDLAELINGSVIGVDIVKELLDLAPNRQTVKYIKVSSISLPFEDNYFDVVWCCLVLGGIPEDAINLTISEFERVLKPGGVFFFVENTSEKTSSDYWFFRSEFDYLRIASFCRPKILGRYNDVGEDISIFFGRK